MKRSRFLLFFVCLFCFVLSRAFAELYFGPYVASSNINLNTPAWKEKVNVNNVGRGDNIFTNDRIVALGALYGLPLEENHIFENDVSTAREYGIRITVTSDSYDNGMFWFVSQSNPDSKRPFNLQFAGPVRRDPKDPLITDYDEKQDYGYVGDSGWKTNANGAYYDAFISTRAFDKAWPNLYSYLFHIIFDVGLVLPGENGINNGILDVDINGTEQNLVIAPADDYSAVITIKIEAIDKNHNVVTSIPGVEGSINPIEYTIPFSGFYDPLIPGIGGVVGEEDVGSSLSINVLSGAANIDLNNQSQTDVPIADIDYAIYNLSKQEACEETYEDSVFIFLSSNPSPYVNDGDGFKFVHESVSINEEPTAENSIYYTITAVDDAGNEVLFDGKDSLHSGENGYEAPVEKLTTVCETQTITHAGSVRHWHTYSGRFYLNLIPNPRLITPGYYDSYVYVHVIVDDSLEVM